jgi:hypothetical protein
MVVQMVFSQKWLDEPAEGDSEGRTNRQVQEAVRFNYQLCGVVLLH